MTRRIYSLITIVVMVVVCYVPMAAAEEWEQVLAAAKKEGTVSLIGPVGSDRSDGLREPFVKKYGIKVEYLAARGSEVGPKLTTERNAGMFLWDVFIGGTSTGTVVLLPGGMLDPLEPALILPEVKDPKQWRGGGIEFVDPGKRFMVMTPSQRGTLYVNPNVVKPDSITSYKDLLNPKYKKKIVMDDPTKSGPGQSTFTFFYLHPTLGPNFIRELAKQEPTVLSDWSLEIDGIAKEKFLVLVGGTDVIAEERIKAGVPIAIIDPRKIKEGSDISPGSGGLAMFNRAPHPNAAKVYINWLLSKEGQTGFAQVNGYISARLDVSTAHSPWRVPIPNSIKPYTMALRGLRADSIALSKEVFGQMRKK